MLNYARFFGLKDATYHPENVFLCSRTLIDY
jgi:hypothetical protein